MRPSVCYKLPFRYLERQPVQQCSVSDTYDHGDQRVSVIDEIFTKYHHPLIHTRV